jgi:dTDP-4-amino-4,6-dideoxygalactose transaminase
VSEREFAEYVGIPYAVAVPSGTAAMHLAMRILGVGPGDEVIASSLTFILAAIGRGQLRVLDERVKRRREIFDHYKSALEELPGIEFMPEAHMEDRTGGLR